MNDELNRYWEIKDKIYTIYELLYGVQMKDFLEHVRRNKERIPEKFILQLTKEEYDALSSQFANLKENSIKNMEKYYCE